MQRALLIADEADEANLPFLVALKNALSEETKLLASGVHLDGVPCAEPGSNAFVEFSYLAELVVVASADASFVRRKQNQAVVLLRPEAMPCAPSTSPSSISHVFSTNATLLPFSQLKSISYIYRETEAQLLQTFTEEVGKLAASPCQPDVLVVTDMTLEETLDQANGPKPFLEAIRAQAGLGNVILLDNGGSASSPYPYFTTHLEFGKDKGRIPAILENFQGIAICPNRYSRMRLSDLLGYNLFRKKGVVRRGFKDVKRCILGAPVGTLLKKPADFTATHYRTILADLYQSLGCSSIPVSVVVLQGVGNPALLQKTLSSLASCGHDNLQAIVASFAGAAPLVLEDVPKGSAVRTASSAKELAACATGRYLLFANEGDVLEPEGVALLLAQAVHGRAGLVGGKSVFLDEEGRVIEESNPSIHMGTFAFYAGASSSSSPFLDAALRGKLIATKTFMQAAAEHGLGCVEHLMAALYASLEGYYFVNVPILRCFGGKDSRRLPEQGLEETAKMIGFWEEVWPYVPQRAARNWINLLINTNADRLFGGFHSYSNREQESLMGLLGAFLQNKLAKAGPPPANSFEAAVATSATDGYFPAFASVVKSRYPAPAPTARPHDIYVGQTHYHLYMAILRTLRSGKPSRLFISGGYASFSPQVLMNLEALGIFETVDVFDNYGVISKLATGLEHCPEDAWSVIPHNVNAWYRKVFSTCDFEHDHVYVFTDCLPWWGFIEPNFAHISKIEDAYNSFEREVHMQKLTARWGEIEDYTGKEFPAIRCLSPKIEHIYVSVDDPRIPNVYRNKLVVDDVKEQVEQLHGRIEPVMVKLYGLEDMHLDENSVLLLTQPLARGHYCTHEEQKELYRRMCEPYRKEDLYIKPHPSDDVDYSYLGGTILPQSVPMEAYNHLGVSINCAMTFGSSAIETIEFAKRRETLFRLHDFVWEDVGRFISDYLYGSTN